MKILVVGSGGREHALVWKLKQSAGVDQMFCAPGNAGTAQVAENVAIPATDLPALLRFAKENAVDLTVVGPDDPLALGIVDLFTGEKLRVFGPTKSAARIESSKIFAKELMRAQRIPDRRSAHIFRQRRGAPLLRTPEFPGGDQGRRARARQRRDHRARRRDGKIDNRSDDE